MTRYHMLPLPLLLVAVLFTGSCYGDASGSIDVDAQGNFVIASAGSNTTVFVNTIDVPAEMTALKANDANKEARIVQLEATVEVLQSTVNTLLGCCNATTTTTATTEEPAYCYLDNLFRQSNPTAPSLFSTKLTAAASGTGYGSVLDFSGAHHISGSPTEIGSDGTTANAGAARVYQNTFPNSLYEGILLFTVQQSPPVANAMVGHSVSLYGEYAIVGAPGDGAGKVIVHNFDYTVYPIVWAENPASPLSAPGAAAGDQVGFSTSMTSNDGEMLFAVGAPGTISGTGAVHIWYGDDHIITFGHTITAPNGAPGDGFGSSVACSRDVLVIGAPHATTDTAVSNAGVAWVFEYLTTTSTWTAMVQLNAAASATSGGGFGVPLDISGTTLAVGVPGDDFKGADAGAVYVYELELDMPACTISSTYSTTKLVLDTGVASDLFGSSVSISGYQLMVGAPGADINGNSTGAAYVYELDTNLGTWSTTSTLVGNLAGSDGFANNGFGSAVSLDDQNDWKPSAVVGAPTDGNGTVVILYST